MVFGMFMAILDSPDRLGLAHRNPGRPCRLVNEISWVQTAYLIAEVVMIPLSGFLSRRSARASVCAFGRGLHRREPDVRASTSINEMIFWRAVQGFIGGGMIPTVFATAFTIFPRSKLGIISPLIGWSRRSRRPIGRRSAAISPTRSRGTGCSSSTSSRHRRRRCGAAADRLRQARLQAVRAFRLDRLLAMAGFLGALEYVLEEGPRNDWFADDSILLFAWVSALSAILFF
jgi:DHA2 family multidrug resistance protein